ncbi:MAG: amidohydrolase, partial [Defluviitaleaceae bacterium]|nr:amidohydrolase [Defluviitaleaceae bacterium]
MLCIKNGTIFTVAQEEPFVGDILVKDGKIHKIGENLAGEATEVVDATGKFVFPGLVDCHSHLGLDGYAVRFESQDFNEITDSLTPHMRAIDAFYPQDRTVNMAAMGGVTTVATGPGSANVLGGTFMVVKTDGDRVDDMVIKTDVSMKCAFGENPKFCHQSKDNFTRMATAAKLRTILNKTKQYIAKKAAAGDDVSKMPNYDEKLEALIPVVEGRMPLKAHAHRTDDILTALRIRDEFGIKMTIEHCTDGHLIAHHLKAAGAPLAIGPTFGHATKYELKNKSFKTPGILQRAGC